MSASTSAKVCADLNMINKVAGVVSAGAGEALKEYTPKKCVGAGVTGDVGKLTGGVTAGVTNE